MLEKAAAEYPDPEYRTLTKHLAQYTKLDPQNIIIGNGAIELIYNAALAFGRTGRILVIAPTFSEYESAACIHGGANRIERFETLNVHNDLDAFAKRIPDDGLVFICNPNNPTGSILGRKESQYIIDKAASSKSCHVIFDECFIEMTHDAHSESIIDCIPKYDNLMVLRSLTKSFGLPGMRIGYAAASTPHTAQILKNVRVPWSVNAPAQAAATAALKHATVILRRTRDAIQKETAYLQSELSTIGCIKSCYETNANFILLQTNQNSKMLQSKLADTANILVRDCSDFYGLGTDHIRVAIKRHKENVALVRALRGVSM